LRLRASPALHQAQCGASVALKNCSEDASMCKLGN
jgi:hypothetical protein